LVRNRLKIFDKSEAEIDALEKSPSIDAVVPITAPVSGVVVDRQIGPGQFPAIRQRFHPGLHDRRYVQRVAARQRARDRRCAREAGQAVEVAVLARVHECWVLNIEAYPDPVPPLVDIVTQSTGQSAEEIERYITIPIEIQMAGIPERQAIRTISLFGLSDVKVQFTYDFHLQQAEQWVINRLSQLGRCRTARSRRSRRPARSARSSAIAWSGRPIFGDRPEDARGLGARAPLQGGARRHRRHRLGRQDQDLRGRDRSAQAGRLRLSVPQVLRRSATPTSTSAARP
jgi:hypothetical protein